MGGERETDEDVSTPRMSRTAEARLYRVLEVMLDLVPVAEMTQAEVDWVFQQKVRPAE